MKVFKFVALGSVELSLEKMFWRRRARVVLPLLEGPERPIIVVVVVVDGSGSGSGSGSDGEWGGDGGIVAWCSGFGGRRRGEEEN